MVVRVSGNAAEDSAVSGTHRVRERQRRSFRPIGATQLAQPRLEEALGAEFLMRREKRTFF